MLVYCDKPYTKLCQAAINLGFLTVKARKIARQPGPYQSVLNSHLVEIAQLRETRPQPTPYRTIAKILKEKYRLEGQRQQHLVLCARSHAGPRSEIKVQDRP